MRTNKEMVLMYMQDMTIKKGEDFKGFTTQELSADLNIQRTNLSAILNDCVKQVFWKNQSKDLYCID